MRDQGCSAQFFLACCSVSYLSRSIGSAQTTLVLSNDRSNDRIDLRQSGAAMKKRQLRSQLLRCRTSSENPAGSLGIAPPSWATEPGRPGPLSRSGAPKRSLIFDLNTSGDKQRLASRNQRGGNEEVEQYTKDINACRHEGTCSNCRINV